MQATMNTQEIQAMHDRNAEASQREVAWFTADKPNRAIAYVKETLHDGCMPTRTVTTWTGDHLGTVLQYGQSQRDAFGNRRRLIVVHGINGRRYWGWFYYDAQDCITLRAYKGR